MEQPLPSCPAGLVVAVPVGVGVAVRVAVVVGLGVAVDVAVADRVSVAVGVTAVVAVAVAVGTASAVEVGDAVGVSVGVALATAMLRRQRPVGTSQVSAPLLGSASSQSASLPHARTKAPRPCVKAKGRRVLG